MTQENNVFIINKQALIQAAIDLEKQEALQSMLLLHCLDQVENIRRKLNMVLGEVNTHKARGAFLQLFMTDEEWARVFTDQQLKVWEEESISLI